MEYRRFGNTIVARIDRLLHFGQLSRKLLVGHIGNPMLQFSTHIAIFHFVSPVPSLEATGHAPPPRSVLTRTEATSSGFRLVRNLSETHAPRPRAIRTT